MTESGWGGKGATEMKITIEIESAGELAEIIGAYDKLRDRITELEREPLRFSLPALAKMY